MVNQSHKVLLKNKFMHIIYIFLFFFSINNLYSQVAIINSPYLISSSGGTLLKDNYNLSFSVGEIAIETLSQNETILTQGFHQENYNITYISEAIENHTIDFYPNPTKDIIYINCNIKEKVDLKLIDIKGVVLESIPNVSGNVQQAIDLSLFSNGSYFLEIVFSDNSTQFYQIQKHN
tara:strand:+ start:2541 stop:3071 length:531 start_codon:yes stop_codon:yes gene_type:complete